jgi:hypothetical protein
MIHVSGLYIYPIKSCAGIAVEHATLDAKGCIDDRRFMIVDDAGYFLTQRELPSLALISLRTDADTLSTRSASRTRTRGSSSARHPSPTSMGGWTLHCRCR